MMKILIVALILLCVFVGYKSLKSGSKVPASGETAPSFDLADATGVQHSLSSYRGKWLVLYFYPKDDTPGCTKEACSFRDDLHKLEALGANVVGVSVDNGSSHAEFAKKYHLPFPLLSDEDGKVADSYGALTDLGMVKIAKRYTYLINPQGVLQKTYLSVDTSRHSQEIIDDLTLLSGAKL